MVDPPTRGKWGEGESTYGISVDFVIELEEDTEASVCQEVCAGSGRKWKYKIRSSAVARSLRS